MATFKQMSEKRVFLIRGLGPRALLFKKMNNTIKTVEDSILTFSAEN